MANAQNKSPWAEPELSFDGELRDLVQGPKPPTIAGEQGDPGHRPTAPGK